MPTEREAPPAGLEREEPEFTNEQDIPTPSNEDPKEVERNTQVHPERK